MRIISGKYGGRRINARIPGNVRPTSDIVRESVFNVLNNLIEFDGIAVLDAFAGTGALGFEALSRGAGFIRFVEKNRKTADIIKNIIAELKIEKNAAEVLASDVIKYLKGCRQRFPDDRFDLIFADPPYHNGIHDTFLEEIAESDCLQNGALIVIEYSSGTDLNFGGRYNILSSRELGGTGYTVAEFIG